MGVGAGVGVHVGVGADAARAPLASWPGLRRPRPSSLAVLPAPCTQRCPKQPQRARLAPQPQPPRRPPLPPPLRSKGFAYVELSQVAEVPAAIMLSGSLLLGQAVAVKPTEAEKNMAWTVGPSGGSEGAVGGGGLGVEDGEDRAALCRAAGGAERLAEAN